MAVGMANQKTGEITPLISEIMPEVKRMSIDFAREIIDKIEREMNLPSSSNGSNKPPIILLTERHGESLLKKPLDKESDLQAAYAAFSALQIAEKKVGAKNVILAVELSRDELNTYISLINSNQAFSNGARDSATADARDSTTVNAIAYAINHGYSIVATDPFERERVPLGDENLKREQEMFTNYSAIATKNPSAMVVGIIGSFHLAPFAGLTHEDVTQNDGNIPPDLQNSSLRPYYSSITLLNAAYLDEEQSKHLSKHLYGWDAESAAAHKFAINPNHVLQGHAPEDLRPHISTTLAAPDIARHVEEAFREKNLTKEHAQLLKALPPAAKNDILSRSVGAQEAILTSMQLVLERQNTTNNTQGTLNHA